MRPRQLIIEALLKEATEEEKLAANLLDGVFDKIASDIKSNKDALAPQQQNEGAALTTLAGVVVVPALMKIIGKGVKLGQNALRKRKGEEPVDSNSIIEMAETLHNMFIGGIESSLFFVGDKKKKRRLAVIIFHAIIAGLLIASGKGLFKALAKHQTTATFFDGMLTAIKTGELGAFTVQTFGELATALGTGAKLADAADLADVASGTAEITSDITETATMVSGDVAGASGGLGKRAKVYDIWNQKSLEETNMNKLKITKGRLRQIIFEEVQRSKRLGEGGMSSADPSGAQDSEAKERAAQEPSSAEDPFYTENLDEADEADEAAPNAKEDAIRELATAATAGKVEGADVDPQQASAVVKVLDSLSDDAKTRFLKLDVSQMAEMAMRLMKEDVAGEDRPESEEHYRGAEADDKIQIRKLKRDEEYDERRRAELGEAKEAKKDYDGDGKIESSTEEWKGSRDKAIKKAEEVDEGAEERVAKFNKGPSTEERREKLKKIAAANKAKKEKDKK